MIRQYLENALHRARYDKLEDGTFVAEVPGLNGVLSTADSLEECREQLAEVIEERVLVRIVRGFRVPPIGGIAVRVSRRR